MLGSLAYFKTKLIFYMLYGELDYLDLAIFLLLAWAPVLTSYFLHLGSSSAFQKVNITVDFFYQHSFSSSQSLLKTYIANSELEVQKHICDKWGYV